ncbi:DMT family transporter [Thermodesulfobacteriota bacterium]
MLNLSGTFSIGPLLMFASAFLFAVLDVLIKILGPSFRVWDIAFYRFGFGLVILTVVIGWQGNPFSSHNIKLLIIRGIAGSVAFLSLVTAIRLIPVSTAMVFFYSFPAFAAFFAPLIFKEKITAAEVFCVIIAFCGVTVLFDFSLQGSMFGQFMGLLGGAAAGITVCLIKKLRETNGPVIIYLYFCLIGSLVSIPPFIANPQIPTTRDEMLIVGGIAFISIVAQLIMNQGFRYCKSWEGGLFLTSELIFISIFGIFFLGETVNWHFWAGGVLIFGSVVALNIFNARGAILSANPEEDC